MEFNTGLFVFLFSAASIQPTLIPYKMVIKNKYWWTYAFSAHALTVSTLAILFSFWYDSNVLKIIAGTLMLISGYGGWILSTVYVIENKRLFRFFGKYNMIYALIHHFFMSLMGVWFLFSISSTLSESLVSIVILLPYIFFMWNRINVPWILYKPSRIPLSTRKFLIRSIMIFLSILLPILSFVVKA